VNSQGATSTVKRGEELERLYRFRSAMLPGTRRPVVPGESWTKRSSSEFKKILLNTQ
jgi:hypothetical protein